MYVVDASVWVARFSETDSFHADSREWITSMMTGTVRLVEPLVVLAEVAGALSRTLNDREVADRAVAMLTSVPSVSLLSIDAPLARQAAGIAAELGLRGYDALYVALAEREQMDLVSWDSEHHSRGSSRVTVHRPSDLLATLKGGAP